MEQIIALLKESNADAWEITETTREGWEFYYIRHALDQNRVRHIKNIQVKVYKAIEDNKYLGSASASISPTATQDEVKAEIDRLVQFATMVKNPYYTLPMPSDMEVEAPVDLPIQTLAKDFLETMKSIPEDETSYLNSYEIFTDVVHKRFVNSNGIDVESTYPSSMVEVVVNAKEEKHEIELYRLYDSGTCDKEGLKQEILETMKYGKDKLVAKDTPALQKAPVIFSTDANVQIYDYFASKMSGAMKYRQMSNAEKGEPIVKDAKGDVFTVQAVKYLPNSSENCAFDEEGSAIRDVTLIEANIAKNFIGSHQYCSYIGEENTFIPSNYVVTGGTKTPEELRKGTYLEVVEFSDFQVDSMNGDMAGEIRLAYYHDGDTVQIVSGGSVSGALVDLAKEMYASKETKQYNNYVVPAITRIENVIVTGIDK